MSSHDRVPVPFGALVLWLDRDVFLAALSDASQSAGVVRAAGHADAGALLSPRDAARRTGTRPEFWTHRCRHGQVPGARLVGRYWRIPAAAVDDLGEAGRPPAFTTVAAGEVTPWRTK